jgi:hypothetical protein
MYALGNSQLIHCYLEKKQFQLISTFDAIANNNKNYVYNLCLILGELNKLSI